MGVPKSVTPYALEGRSPVSPGCRATALGLWLLVGCGRVAFDPVSDPDDTPKPYEPRCLVWTTEFTEDPTMLETNGDGVGDWIMRERGSFPVGELANGIWSASAPTSRPLDTWPEQDFETHRRGSSHAKPTLHRPRSGAVDERR